MFSSRASLALGHPVCGGTGSESFWHTAGDSKFLFQRHDTRLWGDGQTLEPVSVLGPLTVPSRLGLVRDPNIGLGPRLDIRQDGATPSASYHGPGPGRPMSLASTARKPRHVF